MEEIHRATGEYISSLERWDIQPDLLDQYKPANSNSSVATIISKQLRKTKIYSINGNKRINQNTSGKVKDMRQQEEKMEGMIWKTKDEEKMEGIIWKTKDEEKMVEKTNWWEENERSGKRKWMWREEKLTNEENMLWAGE